MYERDHIIEADACGARLIVFEIRAVENVRRCIGPCPVKQRFLDVTRRHHEVILAGDNELSVDIRIHHVVNEVNRNGKVGELALAQRGKEVRLGSVAEGYDSACADIQELDTVRVGLRSVRCIAAQAKLKGGNVGASIGELHREGDRKLGIRRAERRTDVTLEVCSA